MKIFIITEKQLNIYGFQKNKINSHAVLHRPMDCYNSTSDGTVPIAIHTGGFSNAKLH